MSERRDFRSLASVIAVAWIPGNRNRDFWHDLSHRSGLLKLIIISRKAGRKTESSLYRFLICYACNIKAV